MTYTSNHTIPEEVLELTASQGLEAVTELIRRLINQAMLIEREQHLGAAPYQRSQIRAYYDAGSQRLAVRDSSTGLTALSFAPLPSASLRAGRTGSDHLGSASGAVTSSGAVQTVKYTRYKPWGEARGTSASAIATHRLWVPWAGQIYDGDTASGGTRLYFYHARYYDPALGRLGSWRESEGAEDVPIRALAPR